MAGSQKSLYDEIVHSPKAIIYAEMFSVRESGVVSYDLPPTSSSSSLNVRGLLRLNFKSTAKNQILFKIRPDRLLGVDAVLLLKLLRGMNATRGTTCGGSTHVPVRCVI